LKSQKHIWPADVIHCHDWQTALVPVFLRTSYFRRSCDERHARRFHHSQHGLSRTVRRDVLDRAGIPAVTFNPAGIEFYGDVNFLKAGIVYSGLRHHGQRSAMRRKFRTREYGFGLDGVARSRTDRLVGILNGVDYSAWNPAKDPFLPAKYSPKDLSGKAACKQDLLQVFGLPDVPGRPSLESSRVSPTKRF